MPGRPRPPSALRTTPAAHRFQLLGMACLRAAMGDARGPVALVVSRCGRPTPTREELMDPQRFAFISDDTYTPEEVEQFTQVRRGGAARRAGKAAGWAREGPVNSPSCAAASARPLPARASPGSPARPP